MPPSIRDGSDHQYLVNLNPRSSACSIYVWDYKLWVSWFQRRRFLSVSPLMEANDSCGMASLDTSSMDEGMTPPIIILWEVYMSEIKSN